jgi:ribosomal protein S18 acetylase RimI-like enzyme
LTVRPARRSDVAAVAALWQALIEAHAALEPALSGAPGIARELPAAAERLLAAGDGALWVLDDADAVRGFCAARIARSPAAAERRRAEITELWVEPGWRRRGGARALVAEACAWAAARGARRAEVRVAVRNPEGQAFWRALGFGAFVDVLDRRL